jgi:hypothetical protein
MPAIAHIGVGFAAKRISPTVNVLFLIIAAELIEIIFMLLWAVGIEHPPTPETPSFSPYSHSLIMGVLWSILAGMVTWVFSKNKRTSWVIGLLVFSHTILDILASPKTAFYPTDTGMPIFFSYNFTVGLGLWKNSIVAWIGEVGILIAGIGIFVTTKIQIKREGK